jgi:hypothetical protein
MRRSGYVPTRGVAAAEQAAREARPHGAVASERLAVVIDGSPGRVGLRILNANRETPQ